MEKKFKVVTLIGSTKFKDYFIRGQEILTLKGSIVLSPCIFSHADPNNKIKITEDVEQMLDDMGKQRIDMADCVVVINPGNYIGDNTLREIEYAKSKGKNIQYLQTYIDIVKENDL